MDDPNIVSILQSATQSMPHNGYFYTYVTNQSQKKVYFNNLTVHHLEQLLIGAQRKFRAANPALPFSGERGNIRQINDYYPYGLTWSKPEGADAQMYQSKQWQQDEWSTSGLDMYDFHARMYDPVLGRWHAPDPMNQYDSPYTAMGNNPVTTIDPDGMLGIPWGGIISALGSITWQTTKTVVIGNTRNLGVKGTQTTTHSLDASGALQVIGAVIAFGLGSKILNEGQEKLASEASNAAGQQITQQAAENTLPGDDVRGIKTEPEPLLDEKILFFFDTYDFVRWIKRKFGKGEDSNTKHHGLKIVRQTEIKVVNEPQYVKIYDGSGSTLTKQYTYTATDEVGIDYRAYDPDGWWGVPIEGIDVKVTLDGRDVLFGSAPGQKSNGVDETTAEARLQRGSTLIRQSGVYEITVSPTAPQVQWELGIHKLVKVKKFVRRTRWKRLGGASQQD